MSLPPLGSLDTLSASPVDPLALLQSGVTFEQPTTAAVNLVVFAVLSVLTAGGLTVAYRWYFKSLIPEGIAILAGVAVVALYINTASLGVVVGQGSVDLFRPGVVFFNVVALGVSTVAAPVGRRIGDTIASQLFSLVGLGEIDAEVSTMVRSVGRVTSVRLPSEIEDMESYDPVTEETKAELASKTLVFPRRLTVEELRSRLVSRLKEDYGVGYVDVDLTAEGGVDYLAVGSRAAGVGATIAPGTVAVAIRADPPNNATSGDQVQVWSTAEPTERLTSGEIRGVAGDVVTLAVDEADAGLLSPTERYRLLTMPAEPQADREFATLLRSVDETMGTVTVEANSMLVGETADTVAAAVLAIRPSGEKLTALPESARQFESGDTIYVLARPDVLRQLEGWATTPAPVSDDEADAEPTEQAEPDSGAPVDLDDSE
ncbi:potassium transporter TrkA [Halohasta litorea]|uniref:Potassium transporter TrkA n=1 Tax=Halohasta litorea TaxID=869891 RepID=A0ABD6D659_9EURY|nr:potassium transporter TrkA [Halohasta litorea]